MSRRLLQIVPSPDDLLLLSSDEFAWALLEDMQARLSDPTGGMANRESLSGSILSVGAFQSSPASLHALAQRLDRAGRDGYANLERWGLAEPASGLNGRNGYIVLTDKGKASVEKTDFERTRVRSLLKEEMLHPLLRGKIYGYFASDDLGTAVFEAFKTVEIEVRRAGSYPGKEHGKILMFKAFALGGPLSLSSDDKADSEALAGLFAGALSRFRNPGGHTNRTFQDVFEAMEELMFASRLLRLVDERRPAPSP